MSKILYAASTMSHINNFHLDYIEGLRNMGHTVLVMADGEGADFNVPFKKKIFARQNTECRKMIRGIFANERFDAVVLNTTLAAFHIRLAMPRKNRPRVLNLVHGYLFSEHTGFIKTKLFLFCEKILAGKTDSIIVMNKDDELIAKKHKLCREKVFFSRGMGARLKPVSDEKVGELCEKYKDSYVMTFVGELSNRKNQAFLISSLPKLKEKIKSPLLLLVGDGGERESLENLAKSLGVSENVSFVGPVKNPFDYIYASDLYVSASQIEGLPFNILEALACKKTVVISDIKGQSDIVTDKENGYLYPFGDEEAFVSAVISCYEGAKPDSEKIYAAFLKYSFDSVFSETLSLIKESLEL